MSARTLLAVAALCASPFAMAVEGSADAAKDKVAMCIGCHGIPGYQTVFPKTYKVPRIGGQYAEYIVSALQAYRSGDRKHPSMSGIAASMSDQDMADVAAYYAAQK